MQEDYDENASEGHHLDLRKDNLNVPRGRRKRRMERYCKKFCKVDLVIEEANEKDSWVNVSNKANNNKVSRKDARKGIRFRIKSVKSEGIAKLFSSRANLKKYSERSSERGEEVKEPTQVVQHFKSLVVGTRMQSNFSDLVPQGQMVVKNASIYSSNKKEARDVEQKMSSDNSVSS